MKKDILTNIIFAILISLYFITFNFHGLTLGANLLTQCINISSLIFLIIGIIILEIGYKNDKTRLFIYGAEFVVLAILILFMKHLPKVFGYEMKKYSEILMYASIGYYILKSTIQYTIETHRKLQNLSDIKEIIKEEPLKKASKRKNIKIEEGK